MKKPLAFVDSDQKFVLTPSHFHKFDTHPLWIWYDRFGDHSKKDEVDEFAYKLMKSGVLHEESYISGQNVSEVKAVLLDDAIKETMKLMQQGAPLIYQGCLQVEYAGSIYRGRPDLLEKREGSSVFGDWYYAPIEIKMTSNVKGLHKCQLAFYAVVLNELQGVLPYQTGIINRDSEKISYLLEDDDFEKMRWLSLKILKIMKGRKPNGMISRKTKTSPWFSESLREAEEEQDISLIYKMHSKSLNALRKHGLKTLQDLFRADIDTLPEIYTASIERLEKYQLQAQSLIKNETIKIGPLDIPADSSLKIYFDIEGDPFLDVQYLFGFWVSGDSDGVYATADNVRYHQEGGKYFVYFLAQKPEYEKLMWDSFIKWVSVLPDQYHVYHYASYEKACLKKLAKKYGGSLALENFQSNLIDLQPIIQDSIIFPLYFYSIKDIAKYLNFNWRHQKANGGLSIFWYEKWLETEDEAVLHDILDYNEDDVRATECVLEWLLQVH